MNASSSALVAVLVLCRTPLHAQDDADVRAQQFLAGIKEKTPKTVVAVFDISNSMAHQFPGKPAPVLDVARPFAQDLVNNTLRKGDRFVLYSFDKTPTKIFDATINGNLPAVLEAIPKLTTLSKVQGTNIRWAHYEGLKILEKETQKQRPAYLVVLSDGFHDSPDAGDANYTNFYIPLRLHKLPDTKRARDYARLARQFKSKNCGIGVEIADNGMVVEAAAAPTPLPGPVIEPTATPTEIPFGQKHKGEIGAGLAFLAAALAAFAAWSLLFKPIRVGLGQPNDPKKNKIFSMKHGSRITLGGVGAATIPTAFDVPGTKAAVGHILRKGQNFWLHPFDNQPDGAQITVNGQPVTARQHLSFGDQIRVKFEAGARDHLFTWNQASAFRTLLNH